jgi:hypothetical protein
MDNVFFGSSHKSFHPLHLFQQKLSMNKTKTLNLLGLRLLQFIKLKGFLKGYHQRGYWSHSTMQHYHIAHNLGTSCLMRPHLVSKLTFEIPLSGHWRSHWGFAQGYFTQFPKTPKLKTLFMLNWVPTKSYAIKLLS